jgi:hypothetical protein
MTETSAPAPQRPTIAQGLMLLAGAVVMTGGYLALQGALGIADIPLGFFFALYWCGVEQSRRERWAPTFLGGLFGVALAYGLVVLTQGPDPTMGLMIFLAIMLAVVFALIMGWLPLIVNLSAMLYLTVCTLPPVTQNANFPEMAANLTLGAAYFGAVMIGGGALFSQMAKAKAQRAPA